MPYFEGSRGRIHHEAWLPEEAARAAVVLLHGYGEHLGLYDALARRLMAAGHAVHALDCVGHGRSDGERGRIDSWDDYVERRPHVGAHRGRPAPRRAGRAGRALRRRARCLPARRAPSAARRGRGAVGRPAPARWTGWLRSWPARARRPAISIRRPCSAPTPPTCTP